MKYKWYYVTDENGKSNCVIRSFCKLFNEDYNNVFKELSEIAKDNKCSSYNDIKAFEKYLKKRNMLSSECYKNRKIKNLQLDNNSYAIFCWNKDKFYHMVPVINNIIYDKDVLSLNLYVIKIYKKKANKKSL